MALFRRALRWLFLLLGFLVGVIVAIAAFFARYIIRPPRQPLWASPADMDLPYEDVSFPARDGLRLAGWFIPAADPLQRNGAAVVLVHGWPWNRLGESAEDMLSKLARMQRVDLLRLAHALHHEGYHVLMFDLRNHGESAAAPPVTFGLKEAGDLIGALAYLDARDEVDGRRIGVVGFSMGANTTLFALPQTDRIRAAVVVQPTTIAVFTRRYASDLLGLLGRLVLPLTEFFYQLAGGPAFSAVSPTFVASNAGETPVLFVQGEGDEWGSVTDVAEMAAVTPGARGPLFVESTHRVGGYQYAVDHPEVLATFFEQHLG